MPTYPFAPDAATGSHLFSLVRSAGELPYEANVLLPHGKAYYTLVFTRCTRGRHWVNAVPYAPGPCAVLFEPPLGAGEGGADPVCTWVPATPTRASRPWPCCTPKGCAK